MKQLPQLADVATDQQTGGLAVSLVIDRVTASRLGIAPSTIDSTLYDAYGQRQISTMYTQLNQYHVILETDPSFQQSPGKLQDLYIQTNASSGGSGPGASSSFAASGSSSAGSNATTTSRGIHAVLGGAQRALECHQVRRRREQHCFNRKRSDQLHAIQRRAAERVHSC